MSGQGAGTPARILLQMLLCNGHKSDGSSIANVTRERVLKRRHEVHWLKPSNIQLWNICILQPVLTIYQFAKQDNAQTKRGGGDKI